MIRALGATWISYILASSLVFTSACSRPQAAASSGAAANSNAGNGAEPAPRIPFDVRSDSSDLTFFWFDDRGTAHGVSQVSDVPQPYRGTVRVDPSRPELRAPGWVFVTDLRQPGPDGRFPVQAVSTEQFARDLASLTGVPLPQGGLQPSPSGGVPSAPSGQARVVIYGASWCSACHQAAAYLRARGIPFVEHDIETEPAAAQEMMNRAREQGVPTGSIPIIAVNGRLMVGFNPDSIQRALSQGS